MTLQIIFEIFLEKFSSIIDISQDYLIKYYTGYTKEHSTWGHPRVAINLAQWVSVEFDLQVSKWIFQLLTIGNIDLNKKMSNSKVRKFKRTKY